MKINKIPLNSADIVSGKYWATPFNGGDFITIVYVSTNFKVYTFGDMTDYSISDFKFYEKIDNPSYAKI